MGLAHAYHAARVGLKVGVFERSHQANGASIRNFGMLAVVAQAQGKQLDDALRALSTWQQIAPQAGVNLANTGCLIVAQHQKELAVLQEFAADNRSRFTAKLVNTTELSQYANGLNTKKLIGGLWSEHAWKVDQQQACIKIAGWLAQEHAVTFHYSTAVNHIETGKVYTRNALFGCDTVIICAGSELHSLFADDFSATGVTECQLQMLRTYAQPDNWRLKPFIIGGLSLPRYSAFADCPSLHELIKMQQADYKKYLQHGIHIIVCQEGDGSITIGDSHQYADNIDSQHSDEIDRLILNELDAMLQLPVPQISQRWRGRYAYLAGKDVLRMQITENVHAVTMTNGQGMTHAFAQAEDVINSITN